MGSIKRVAITGPESTGKSMLAEHLANHYKTVWVPEYARAYLGEIKRPYGESDILEIAKGQVLAEAKMIPLADRIIFCDTELIVTKIWSEVKYQCCDPWILDNILQQGYDLYLLCDIDLPWEYDPLREHPHMRAGLFELYRRELTDRKFPFAVIGGYGPLRLEHAVGEIDRLMQKEHE